MPTPPAPSIPGPLIVCEGDTALLTASGAPTFDWSLFSDFSPIDTTNVDFLIAAPDSVYVRSVNQDDSATVSCPGAISATEILTEVCDVIILSQDLLDFNALKNNDKALLSWIWKSEIDDQHFNVEHSRDGISFDLLDNVVMIPSGSSEQLYYQVFDNQPYSGWNYYRLQFPLNDLDYQYSQIRALNFADDSEVISVYPSPTIGIVNVGFTNIQEEPCRFIVRDVLGKTVMMTSSPAGISKYELNLSSLAAAVYVISIEAGQGTQHIRIIKQ